MIVNSPPKNWLPVSIAPADADLEVCVVEQGDIHRLTFAVRKWGSDWVNASTRLCIDIRPTHWRYWTNQCEI
jgi:hypothetical protein